MAKTLKLKPLPILNCYPRMSEIERKDFHADIKKNGLREKMIFWKSATGDLWLLDGRERQDGCVAADTELKIEEHYEAYPGDDPIQFVLSRKHRSHLTSSQRSASSAKILANLPTSRQTKFGKFAELSQEDVAQLNGVSTRSVTDAVLVMEKNPDLFEKVWRGEIAVSKAAAQVRRAEAAANPSPAANGLQVAVSQQETELRTASKGGRDRFNELLKNLNKKNRSRDNMQTVIAALRAFSALKPMLEGIFRQTLVVADVIEHTLPPEELTEQQLIKEANITLNHLILLIAGRYFVPPQPDKDGKIHYLLEHLEQLREAVAKYQRDAAAALEKTKQEDEAQGIKGKEDEEEEAKESKKKRAKKVKQNGGEDDFQTTAEVANDLGGVEPVKLRLLIENKKITRPERIETDDPSDDGYRWNAENKEEARNALEKSSESQTEETGDGLRTAQVAEVMSQRLNGAAVRADELLLLIANGKISSPKLIDEKDRQDVNDDGYRWSHEIVEEAIVAYPPFKESLAAKSSTQHKPTLAEAQAKINDALDQTYRVTHGPHNPAVQAPHSKTPTAVELPPTGT